MGDDRHVVGRTLPAAGFLQDIDMGLMRGKVGGRPDVIEPPAAIGRLPVLGTINSLGIFMVSIFFY